MPALISRFARGDQADELRERLEKFEERLDAMEPADERQETRIAWARRRLARGRADVDFEEREPITARGSIALAWAGMRGVVTVAAAQTIPVGTEGRDTVVLAAFLVALITLVLFGLTLPAVITRLRFRPESPEERRDSVQELLRQVGEAAADALGPLEEQTIDGQPVDPALAEQLRDRVLPRILSGIQQKPRVDHPGALEQSMILQRRYLDAMRDALNTERSIGAYSSETYRHVQSILDTVEQRSTQV